MRCQDRNIDRLADIQPVLLSIECDLRAALNDHPVLGSLSVFLIAEPLAGQNFNPLYLVGFGLVEDRKASPWPLVVSHRGVYCRHGRRVYAAPD
jgi:hypothetical protein